jgi:hypothetical protein
MFNIPGKIQYDKRINVSVSIAVGTMLMDTQTWVPGGSSLFEENFSNWKVDVELDGAVMASHTFLTPDMDVYFDFPDTDELTSHTISVKFSGKDPVENTTIENFGEGNPMWIIKKIQIEKLNMFQTFEDVGKCICYDSPDIVQVPSKFMGSNGYHQLEFTTPMYHWLLDNEKESMYYYNNPGDNA